MAPQTLRQHLQKPGNVHPPSIPSNITPVSPNVTPARPGATHTGRLAGPVLPHWLAQRPPGRSSRRARARAIAPCPRRKVGSSCHRPPPPDPRSGRASPARPSWSRASPSLSPLPQGNVGPAPPWGAGLMARVGKVVRTATTPLPLHPSPRAGAGGDCGRLRRPPRPPPDGRWLLPGSGGTTHTPPAGGPPRPAVGFGRGRRRRGAITSAGQRHSFPQARWGRPRGGPPRPQPQCAPGGAQGKPSRGASGASALRRPCAKGARGVGLAVGRAWSRGPAWPASLWGCVVLRCPVCLGVFRPPALAGSLCPPCAGDAGVVGPFPAAPPPFRGADARLDQGSLGWSRG